MSNNFEYFCILILYKDVFDIKNMERCQTIIFQKMLDANSSAML